MEGGVKSLVGVFGMTDFMIPMVLDDLTDEQAYERPRGDGGPSIAWTIGHLLYYRGFMLERFGRKNPVGERLEPLFANAAASDGSDYPSLEELRRLWDETSSGFVSALSALDDEALDTPLMDGWHAEQTLRDQVVFFAWHEGYHVGAIGQIRKELGLLGPAERVAAMRKAQKEGAGG